MPRKEEKLHAVRLKRGVTIIRPELICKHKFRLLTRYTYFSDISTAISINILSSYLNHWISKDIQKILNLWGTCPCMIDCGSTTASVTLRLTFDILHVFLHMTCPMMSPLIMDLRLNFVHGKISRCSHLVVVMVTVTNKMNKSTKWDNVNSMYSPTFYMSWDRGSTFPREHEAYSISLIFKNISHVQ